MAEINTESKEKGGFIFGQNMEERVIKPPEEREKSDSSSSNTQEKTENGNASQSQDSSHSSSVLRPSVFKSSGILAPSRLGMSNNPFVSNSLSPGGHEGARPTDGLSNNPFAAKTSLSAHNSDDDSPNNSSARFVLKPSSLDKQTAVLSKGATSFQASPKCSFKLEPAKLQSPLSHAQSSEVSKETNSGASAAGESQTNTRKTNAWGATESSSTPTRKKSPWEASADSDTPTSTSEQETPATGGTSDGDHSCAASVTTSKDKAESSSSQADGQGFVFGQNVHDRVCNSNSVAQVSSSTSSSSSSFVFGENLADRVTATPSKSTEETNNVDKKSPSDAAEQTSPTQTLAESAAAHEARKAKPELQEVQVVTGEENESNVFQVNAKLYAFEKDTQNWLERGRGLLRLNDMTCSDSKMFQSRLVMRTQGILRVVLNTKIWAGMTVDRASPKSVRITAVDGDDGVKVFLISANPKDAEQIFSAIDSRVQQLRMEGEWQEESQAAVSSTQGSSGSSSTVGGATSTTLTAAAHPEKRPTDDATEETHAPTKRAKIDPDQRRELTTEESNDSSTLDPETEASNESFSSTIRSSSSE